MVNKEPGEDEKTGFFGGAFTILLTVAFIVFMVKLSVTIGNWIWDLW